MSQFTVLQFAVGGDKELMEVFHAMTVRQQRSAQRRAVPQGATMIARVARRLAPKGKSRQAVANRKRVNRTDHLASAKGIVIGSSGKRVTTYPSGVVYTAAGPSRVNRMFHGHLVELGTASRRHRTGHRTGAVYPLRFMRRAITMAGPSAATVMQTILLDAILKVRAKSRAAAGGA